MRSRLGARSRPPASRLAWPSSQARRSPISTLPDSCNGGITGIVGVVCGAVATECVIRPWERQLFLGCRRAWDLGAHERRGFESAAPSAEVDLDLAVKDALAVYYFPGMWDWNRAIVAPLATEAFACALRSQRQTYEAATGAPLDEAAA